MVIITQLLHSPNLALDDKATFPFWLYLRLNVRACVDDLYVFGWTVPSTETRELRTWL